MTVEQKLEQMGLAVPDLASLYASNPAGARYISHCAVQNLLFLSGTTPIKDGRPYLTGMLGRELTVEQGYEAARYAALTTLAAVKYALGDLERVQQFVQVIGYVSSATGFTDQPRVVNGATDLLVAVFGDRGKPTRAAIGCHGLAANHSVEIVATVLFSGTEVRRPLHRDQGGR